MQPQSIPLIIAHRGGANLRPENSMAAFAHALAVGSDGIECDIQCSRDGQLVIHHDLHLNPSQTRLDGHYISPPLPAIAALDYAALCRYDIGRLDPTSNYANKHPDQIAIDDTPIPLFADLCTYLDGKVSPDFKIIVEIKSTLTAATKPPSSIDPSFTKENRRLIAALNTLLATHSAAKNLAKNMIFVSFDWHLLAQIKQHHPDQTYGFITIPFAIADPAAPVPELALHKIFRTQSETGAPYLGDHDWRPQSGANYREKILKSLMQASKAGVQASNTNMPKWFAYWGDINAETLSYAKALNMEVSVWTINNLEMMRRFAAQGVHNFITDEPVLAKNIFTKQL
ncbi:MAG: hypothetical protein HAW65_00675 [Alphaproteobacteria bacterium]|nr:hypothetical protein [Alphaproteobacteria bacterium]MBE8219809.1 hypothetical protein [Alphaproteobacteria bacterium]